MWFGFCFLCCFGGFFFNVAEIKTFISKFIFAPFTSCGTLWKPRCPTGPGSPTLLVFPMLETQVIDSRTHKSDRQKSKRWGYRFNPFLLASTAEQGRPTVGIHCVTDGGLWRFKPLFLLWAAPETPQRYSKDTEAWQKPSMYVQSTCFLHCCFLYSCGLHSVTFVLWRRDFGGWCQRSVSSKQSWDHDQIDKRMSWWHLYQEMPQNSCLWVPRSFGWRVEKISLYCQCDLEICLCLSCWGDCWKSMQPTVRCKKEVWIFCESFLPSADVSGVV